MHTRSSRRCQIACLITSIAFVESCSSPAFVAPNSMQGSQVVQRQEFNSARDLDVLFMIDNSLSMAEEQENLATKFPLFMHELSKIEGGQPNIHIAVISSDVGAGPKFAAENSPCNDREGDIGKFQVKPECGLAEGARFIKSYKLGNENNFVGRTLPDVFACLANLGTGGCGFEHQLQSVTLALSDRNIENAGFLRPKAHLAIILITDEDDCSAEPTSDLFLDKAFPSTQAASLRCNLVGHTCNGMPPLAMPFETALENCSVSSDPEGRLIAVRRFVDHIKGLKQNPDEQIFVSAITGQPAANTNPQYGFHMVERGSRWFLDVQPICSNRTAGTAAPALRISQFVQAFGPNNGWLESICSDDFGDALARIGQRLRERVTATCVSERLFDVDPTVEGLQVDCTVEERVPMPNGQVEAINLPACADGVPGACWKLLQPNAAGMCGNKFAIDVDRRGQGAIPGTTQTISCRSCTQDDASCFTP